MRDFDDGPRYTSGYLASYVAMRCAAFDARFDVDA